MANQLRNISEQNGWIRVRVKRKGKPYFDSFEGSLSDPVNIKRAIEIREKMLAQIRLGLEPNTTEVVLFGWAMQQYMNTAKEFKRLGEYTYKHYRDDLNRYWSHLFDVPMVAVGPRDLRKVLSKVKGKPKHKQNVFAPVRGGFKHAQSEGWIDTNPCLAISFGKTQKPPPDYFKPREQEDLLSKMEGQSYRYAKLFFETGMRPCETLAIYEYDIDFDEATLTVERAIVDGKPQPYTKTHKIRKVYLTPDAVLVLKQQLPHSVKGKLFNWMTTKVPHEAMREAMRGAEMRVRRPYCARHTRASTLLTTMEDAAFSARQLGHSQYTFQTVYASWIDELENKDKAAAITGIKTKPKLELVQAEGV